MPQFDGTAVPGSVEILGPADPLPEWAIHAGALSVNGRPTRLGPDGWPWFSLGRSAGQQAASAADLRRVARLLRDYGWSREAAADHLDEIAAELEGSAAAAAAIAGSPVFEIDAGSGPEATP